MLARLLIALGLVVLGLLIAAGWKRYTLHRRAADLQLEGYRPGRAAVLYFYTRDCLTCASAQRPALAALIKASDGKIQLLEADAENDRLLAEAWGVLSVPTTFLIDSQGRPRRVNNGLVRSQQLLSQFIELGEIPPPAHPAPQRSLRR